MGEDDADDFQDQDYGYDYYDEEDQSMDDALLRQQLAQQQKMAAMKQPAYSGPGSKPIGTNLMQSSVGQFGNNFGAGTSVMGGTQFGAPTMGGTQFGAPTMGGTQFGALAKAPTASFGGTQFGSSGPSLGSGGFTYGMASAGGVNSFGAPTQPGAKPQSAPLGGQKQAAPVAGGFAFGSASQFGGIGGGKTFGSSQFGTFSSGTADPYANVDLDLSKVKTVPIPSKPFEKKSEEEKQNDKQTGNKSNLKTTKEDFAKKEGEKKEVRFGKSITYEVQEGEDSVLSDKKIIGEKDLSDGRDEVEKIRAQLEAEESKQLEELRRLNEQKKQAKPAELPKKVEPPKNEEPPKKVEPPKKAVVVADSYTSDDFEDSGSGSQSSVSVKPPVKIAAAKPLNKIEESSDIYEDDDFESLSRSNNAMEKALPVKKPLPTVQTVQTQLVKPPTPSLPAPKRENQVTMTDEGKYSYSQDPTSGASTMKELQLKRKIEDLEQQLAQQRISLQESKDESKQLELQLAKQGQEINGFRRDILNQTETNKRLDSKNQDLVHKCNLYRVEVEELIKQVDMADMKCRSKEDELGLKEQEFDRKLKQIEDRILFQRGKNENREVADVKREYQILLEELQNKMAAVQEENDYLQTKLDKLEQQNKEIRLQKDPKDQIKKLQQEVEYLSKQLGRQGEDSGVIKKELSVSEQIKLQKELQQMDLLIKGYQEEIYKSDLKCKDLQQQVKQHSKSEQELKKQVHELQMQMMLQKDELLVQEVVTLQTQNVLGTQAISVSDLKDLQQAVVQVRLENDTLKREWAQKEEILKVQTKKVLGEKQQVEKQLYQSEFLVQEKDAELSKQRDESMKDRLLLEEQIKELESKVAWFRQNQSLLTDQEQQLQCDRREIQELKAKLRDQDKQIKDNKDYQKRCKLLEETLKSKHPTLVTSDLAPVDNQNEKQLKYRIQSLEAELDQKDKEFETRLRAMRQEQERMRLQYEQRTLNPAEARKVSELEQEIVKTKQYYQKRIRDLEDKYKFKVSLGTEEVVKAETKPKTAKEAKTISTTDDGKDEQIRQLQEDRNMLVQRLQASVQKCLSLEQQLSQQPKESPREPPKSTPHLNPFFVEEPQPRSVPQLLKHLQAHQPKLSQLASLTKQDLKQFRLTESESSALFKFIEDHTENALEEGMIEVSDLLDLIATQTPGQCSPEAGRAEETAKDTKLLRLQREKEDNEDFLNQQIRQLKRQVQQATIARDDIQEQFNVLEGQKIRLEKFIKQGLSKESSQEDLIQDVNFMLKRLEVMEQQQEQRQMLAAGDPWKRKAEQLQQQLIDEKQQREQVIQRKNAEVLYFKKELASLLDEIAKKR